MKVLSIVGTRPQFLKLAPLSKKFDENKINHIIVHSGQHYNKEMSEDIFRVLNIRNPDYILENSKFNGISRLCNMLKNIEEICLKEQPDKIIVFGDCDTTLAGSIVAKVMKIYLIHIESGMRSYNKLMPEEINRLISDHVADLLLCSTKDSLNKLENENIKTNAYYVGNLQLELLQDICEKYNNKNILLNNNLIENDYALMTIHRDYNVNKNMLEKIFLELTKLTIVIVFPIHPRTKNTIKQHNIIIPNNILLIKPVNYLDMTILQRFCNYIITDSGGIQPEAWFLKKKCIILRTETEWIEPLKNNNNIIYDYKTPLNKFIENFLKIDILDVNIDLNASYYILKLLTFPIPYECMDCLYHLGSNIKKLTEITVPTDSLMWDIQHVSSMLYKHILNPALFNKINSKKKN